MNVADVKTRVKRTFGDESAVQVSDDDIIRWINDGQREVIMQNPTLLEEIVTTDVVAGQQDYAFPTNLRQLRSLEYKNSVSTSYVHIEGMSLHDFDRQIDGWDGTLYGQADPVVYCTFKNTIKIFPIPSTDVTAGLKLYYFRNPVDVALDTDEIDLPIGYHSAIVEYCLKYAYEMDEDWTSVVNKAQEFNAAVSGQKFREKDHNQEQYPRITVLPEDMDWF